jgi:glycosyltransferase involved in cell wall biosynthesis
MTMRIGLVWDYHSAASHYRAGAPAEAMQRRRHEVITAPSDEGDADFELMRDCDVVLVYRRYDDETRAVVRRLAAAGVGIVYDNDDDYLLVPEEHPNFAEMAGLAGQRRFAHTLELARIADVMTTTTQAVAERYRSSGVERVEVIPNYLRHGAIRAGRPHEGLVVGWVAGLEHVADTRRIPIADALERLVAKHGEVRVECIGVDLGLSRSYFHDAVLPFDVLPDRIAGFDIGIAPLADIPFNRARSDIKVKEYAASGVPWLGSPVGPYRGLGEGQGGRLVPDDGWFDALDRLVRKNRERRRLADAATRWARTQTIHAAAARWEQVLAEAGEAGLGRNARSKVC